MGGSPGTPALSVRVDPGHPTLQPPNHLKSFGSKSRRLVIWHSGGIGSDRPNQASIEGGETFRENFPEFVRSFYLTADKDEQEGLFPIGWEQ
jgi:hypothetical protein